MELVGGGDCHLNGVLPDLVLGGDEDFAEGSRPLERVADVEGVVKLLGIHSSILCHLIQGGFDLRHGGDHSFPILRSLLNGVGRPEIPKFLKLGLDFWSKLGLRLLQLRDFGLERLELGLQFVQFVGLVAQFAPFRLLSGHLELGFRHLLFLGLGFGLLLLFGLDLSLPGVVEVLQRVGLVLLRSEVSRDFVCLGLGRWGWGW